MGDYTARRGRRLPSMRDRLPVEKLRLKDRIKHFTFAWFTLTMSTAGVAHVLHSVPLRFVGLYAIGCIFLFLGIVFFLSSCLMMGLRFYWWPSTFRAAFLHPTESLFIPAFAISIASVLINITEYGLTTSKTGFWLVRVMIILYWMYIVLAFISSCGIYLTIWSTQTFTLAQMTPIWIFPAYPMLVVGPFAGVLATSMQVHNINALEILTGGFVVQGTGFMVALTIYSAYIYRLMTQKLPAEGSRPAMFVSVGPSAFTVSGLINIGNHFPKVVPPDFMGGSPLVGPITQVLAYWAGLGLWGLAVWFFLISAFAHWSCVSGQRLSFAMPWYAFIFPNTALITATFNVAKALGHIFALQVIGCVMTCILIAVWAVVVALNIKAIASKQLLWPQKQEDSDAHLFSPGNTSRHADDLDSNGSLPRVISTQSQHSM